MHGASVVLHATRPALLASSMVCICRVLPELKPYQPNQRKKIPKTQRGTLGNKVVFVGWVPAILSGADGDRAHQCP